MYVEGVSVYLNFFPIFFLTQSQERRSRRGDSLQGETKKTNLERRSRRRRRTRLQTYPPYCFQLGVQHRQLSGWCKRELPALLARRRPHCLHRHVGRRVCRRGRRIIQPGVISSFVGACIAWKVEVESTFRCRRVQRVPPFDERSCNVCSSGPPDPSPDVVPPYAVEVRQPCAAGKGARNVAHHHQRLCRELKLLGRAAVDVRWRVPPRCRGVNPANVPVYILRVYKKKGNVYITIRI